MSTDEVVYEQQETTCCPTIAVPAGACPHCADAPGRIVLNSAIYGVDHIRCPYCQPHEGFPGLRVAGLDVWLIPPMTAQ